MKNSLLLGVLIGALAPAVSYLLTVFTSVQTSFFAEKPIALYVIAATINLVILRFSYRSGKDLLGKGVILITFVAMLLLIFGNGLKI